MAKISFYGKVSVILFVIQTWQYVGIQGEENKRYAIFGEQFNLTYSVDGSENVTWLYTIDGRHFLQIYVCVGNHSGCIAENAIEDLTNLNFQAIRSNNASVLSMTPPDERKRDIIIQLNVGNIVTRTYTITPINENVLASHCAHTLPINNENGFGMTLSCNVITSQLRVNLSLDVNGVNILGDASESSKSLIKKNIYFENFMNVYNASCNAHFPDIDITNSCSYPNIVKEQDTITGDDIIFKCSDENNLHFYSSNGSEEDIDDRLWSRAQDPFVLIRNISEQDIGKAVVCRSKGVNESNVGTIRFSLISKSSRDESSSPDSKIGGRTPTSGDHHNIYLVLTLSFLSLWVVTTVVGGLFIWVKTKENKPDTMMASSPLSGHTSRISNGTSNDHETPLSIVGTRDRRDPDTTNTNNSAHNPVFEPETSSTDENRWNRQGNDGNHLYFTLEKSSPSPKASSSRQERPGSSMNHPRGSQWQGYETVGDPDKGVFCSFDLGEYADVSFQGKVTSDLSEYSEVDATQFRGTAPPGAGEYFEVRRSFRGKEQPTLPDRTSLNKIPKGEQVERDEISRLYGKVKK